VLTLTVSDLQFSWLQGLASSFHFSRRCGKTVNDVSAVSAVSATFCCDPSWRPISCMKKKVINQRNHRARSTNTTRQRTYAKRARVRLCFMLYIYLCSSVPSPLQRGKISPAIALQRIIKSFSIITISSATSGEVVTNRLRSFTPSTQLGFLVCFLPPPPRPYPCPLFFRC
jgi:hypothetical protein